MSEDREPCWYCNLSIDHEPGVPVFGAGPELAHATCKDRADESAFDRNEESKISDYYGASTPQTDRERGEIAAREKKEFG